MFEGDRTKFRNWVFDLGIAVGFVDRHLSEALTCMMTGLKDIHWIPEEKLVPGDGEKSKAMHEKYAGELYGLLCSITGGEAKSLVRGIRNEMGQTKMDGSSALLELGRRFDTQNSATMLQALLEVVVPPKNYQIGRCNHFHK